MNQQDSEAKRVALSLIARIKEHTRGLQDVLWSQEELMANKEFLNTASQKINDSIDLIAKNLYWYQKVGWKKFLLDRAQVEQAAFEAAAQEEKLRFGDWLAASAIGMDFYRTFPQQFPEAAIMRHLPEGEALTKQAILDVGCRDGCWLQKLIDMGARPQNLAGIEPCDTLFAEAERALGKRIPIAHGYPDTLPFQVQQFDVVLVFGMLMHVLEAHLLQRVCSQLVSVLSQHGVIFVVNASEQYLAQQDPYIAYTTRVLTADHLQALFPQYTVQFETTDTMTLAIITRDANSAKGCMA
ncbi:class I SAM-dependent methyltransferase [Alicyclobacillus fodiniaquatilis]|uniref:Class I SAM-dependent methyltransferase n=1 Tax=Alicyclobacillus fodiniaquatilis TaxID=1661150 RepID=A0ABW4JCW8_9BACL